ncbi:serpin family protein [Novosphingobium sp. KN65.2]|uniref:serpin family protein n=1 Tax=Novosphingobium sp. KN65.2 TaxID=1478134 RepID=UPI0005DD53C7|nr:serpin family protein [Novosphingobium sp. KN65.2]CDO34988.1 conserved exported hypothetical protein [Novosphingobium sp. KN65.2]
MKIVKLVTTLAALAALPVSAMAQEAVAPASFTVQTDPYGAIKATLPPDAQGAVAGINAFSLDLYKRTISSGDNLFLSPASVSTAVALAYRGAVGKTADELRSVLHYGAAPDAYFRASAGVFATMNFSGQSRVLQTANAIWIQGGMPMKPDYLADVQSQMKAGLQRANFAATPEQARADINAWVATATHDRIAELLEKGVVTPETSTVLVNTIYWKGRWDQPFVKSETKVEPFTRLDGTKQSTPLMNQRSYFAVVKGDGVQAIELHYVGGEVSMVVFLPHSPKGLPKFEAGLTDKELGNWFTALDAAEPRDTVLTLPKMHLEYGIDFAKMLSTMGAPTAFSDDADFSGMAQLPSYSQGSEVVGLKISHIIHKAWLDVDEDGSEAAAATAVINDIVTGRRSPPPPPTIFRADKPFLFVLRDRRTGLILFMGRYVAPTNQ